MKVYKISADFAHYDSCKIDYAACAHKHQFDENELLIDFDGTPQAKSWWPRIMVRNHDNPLGDYVNKISSDVIILERKAIEKLRDIMGKVEILPLECDFGDYWAINVLAVLECIDREKSMYKTFSKSLRNGRPKIMRFIKYAFLQEVICGHHIFKNADEPKSAIFVDEVFVNTVNEHGITGFKFDLVWESE